LATPIRLWGTSIAHRDYGTGKVKGGGVGMGIDNPVTKSEGFLVHRVSLI
jgi:hypothetical protein